MLPCNWLSATLWPSVVGQSRGRVTASSALETLGLVGGLWRREVSCLSGFCLALCWMGHLAMGLVPREAGGIALAVFTYSSPCPTALDMSPERAGPGDKSK